MFFWYCSSALRCVSNRFFRLSWISSFGTWAATRPQAAAEPPRGRRRRAPREGRMEQTAPWMEPLFAVLAILPQRNCAGYGVHAILLLVALFFLTVFRMWHHLPACVTVHNDHDSFTGHTPSVVAALFVLVFVWKTDGCSCPWFCLELLVVCTAKCSWW